MKIIPGATVQIKEGWKDTGIEGVALTKPFKDTYGQEWVVVDWDKDPECFKLAGLETI